MLGCLCIVQLIIVWWNINELNGCWGRRLDNYRCLIARSGGAICIHVTWQSNSFDCPRCWLLFWLILAWLQKYSISLKFSLRKAKESRQHPEVFPGGPPPQYWPGPMLLNFGGRQRSGAFNMAWPSAPACASCWRNAIDVIIRPTANLTDAINQAKLIGAKNDWAIRHNSWTTLVLIGAFARRI